MKSLSKSLPPSLLSFLPVGLGMVQMFNRFPDEETPEWGPPWKTSCVQYIQVKMGVEIDFLLYVGSLSSFLASDFYYSRITSLGKRAEAIISSRELLNKLKMHWSHNRRTLLWSISEKNRWEIVFKGKK